MFRDECKLLFVLPMHAVTFSPAFLITPQPTSTLAILIFIAAVASSIAFSASSTWKGRCICGRLPICTLSWLYTSLHASIVVVSVFSIRHFLLPFLSTSSFQDNCRMSAALQANTAGLSCPDLQSYVATSLVLQTASVAVSFFMLVLGHRISKKQLIEYRRVKKELERHQSNNTPSSASSSDASLLIQHPA
ncbi:hypothetical protein H310_07316 [Aphanomyces invadans]|uniref:Uncharacterized protein n=1 Tax=Aphanomyces invadans TaxID=157072 RepID=A0A024U3E1_9STRA|nr:hypothetical protein H310_07316 [Aphanomyces invadans]ETW00779.1 hypothetical protein H310_07316 [Aphanomyces invadans]|eukprot:XP_008870914.1 hypothetical protein H310_07316 [Aphanomyces invadans]